MTALVKSSLGHTDSSKTSGFITGRFFLSACGLIVALLLTLLYIRHSYPVNKHTVYEIDGETMGTTFEIRFTASKPLSDSLKLELKEGVSAILDTINAEVNHYDPASQISRYNKLGVNDSLPVGSHFIEILKISEQAHTMTSGGFNPEIASLVRLWGFGPESLRRNIPPSAAEITALLPTLQKGYRYTDDQILKKINTHSSLDFSGVAKGYAVDQIGYYLQDQTITDYLINIGGELRASGNASDRSSGWIVAIVSPVSGDDMLAQIRLTNRSIATSGIYFNQFRQDETVYSHLINPIDGSAVREVVSISIISKNCALADALATGLSVLNPDQLHHALQNSGSEYDYLIVTQSGEQLRSAGFPKTF